MLCPWHYVGEGSSQHCPLDSHRPARTVRRRGAQELTTLSRKHTHALRVLVFGFWRPPGPEHPRAQCVFFPARGLMSSASQPPRSAKPRAAAPPVASTRIGATGGGVAAPAHRGDASAVEQVQVLQAAMQSLRQDVATLKRQAVASDAHHRSEIEGLKRARLDDKEDGPVRRYQCGFCDRYMTDCQKSCAGWRAAAEAAAAT